MLLHSDWRQFFTKGRQGIATDCICVTSNNWNWKHARINQEGSTSHDVGMWELYRLHPWEKDNDTNWSQTSVSASNQETIRELESLPPRILHFHLQLSIFDYHMEHVPGKLSYTADTLSRSPVSSAGIRELALQYEAELFATVSILSKPAST